MGVQLRIERSLYEAVRLQLVSDGYTPDITTFPNTQAGTDAYQAALQSIANTKGFAIELFGQSNSEEKGYKKIARVVLLTDSWSPGDFGIEPGGRFTLNGTSGNFDMYEATQNITHEAFVNCHIVFDSTSQYRYLVELITKAIPLRGMLPYYDDSEDGFFMENIGFIDMSSPKEGISEKLFRYRIPDIIWTEDVITANAAVPITEIDLNIQIAKYLGVPGVWSAEAEDYTSTEYVIT